MFSGKSAKYVVDNDADIKNIVRSYKLAVKRASALGLDNIRLKSELKAANSQIERLNSIVESLFDRVHRLETTLTETADDIESRELSPDDIDFEFNLDESSRKSAGV